MSNLSAYNLRSAKYFLVEKYKEKRKDLKKKIKNHSLSNKERYEAMIELDRMSIWTRKVRYSTQCLDTYKFRGVDRKSGLCEFALRTHISLGNMPGYKAKSW